MSRSLCEVDPIAITPGASGRSELVSAGPVADPGRHGAPSVKPIGSSIHPLGHQAEPSRSKEVTPGHFVLDMN